MEIDVNGQIFVKPDFNGERPPYRIETSNDLRGILLFVIICTVDSVWIC